MGGRGGGGRVGVRGRWVGGREKWGIGGWGVVERD